MGRERGIWHRKGRGFFTTMDGKQIHLGDTEADAYTAFRRLTGAGPTVGDVLDEWLAWQDGRSSPHRAKCLRSMLGKARGGPLWGLPVDQARPHHLASWIDSRASWGPSTRWAAGKAIMAAFSWAIRMGRVSGHPFRGCPLPTPRRRESCPDREAFHAALERCHCPRVRDYLEVLWETGARGGEADRIEAKHLDLPAGTVTLPEHKTAKKTGRPRVVYLSPRAAAILGRLAGEHPAGPLLRTTRGRPWSGANAHAAFRRLGLTWTRHSLRHAFATDALLAGEDVATVAALLGHSTPTTTLSVYAHAAARKGHVRAAAARVRGGAA